MFTLLMWASALLALPCRSTTSVGVTSTTRREHANSDSDDLNFFRFRDFVPRYTINNNYNNLNSTIATREGRGFQFHVHNDDLIVHLEFTVPLVEIPVDRSVAFARTALRNLVNLNVSSLLVSIVVLAIGGVIFALLKTLSTPVVYSADYYAGKKQARVDDTLLSEQNSRVNFVDTLEQKLQAHNIDTTACLQHTVCHYFSESEMASKRWHNIFDGLIDLQEVRTLVSGSPLQRAIVASRDGSRSCASLPGDCRWLGAANGLARAFSQYLA